MLALLHEHLTGRGLQRLEAAAEGIKSSVGAPFEDVHGGELVGRAGR